MPNKSCSVFITRRKFLRLGLALPLISITAALPLELMAKSRHQAKIASPLPDKKPRPPRLLVIDPGHGGHDPGAIGQRGLKEKEVTLDIAKQMQVVFGNNTSVKIKLTRDHDIYLPLKERVKISRDARADLFISIHADSAPNKSARGLSVYTLSQKASDKLAEALAEKENRADVIGGVDLSKEDQEVAAILLDLTTSRTCNTAERIKAKLVDSLRHKWQLLDSPMRSANFAVLRAPDVPSILVETGFLSNSKDEAILRQPKMRLKIARLMAKELEMLLNDAIFS